MKKIKIWHLISLLFIGILIISLFWENYVTTEGTVIDIYQYEDNYKRPVILIENKDGPSSVSFAKDVNINNIELNDQAKITTDGIVRESYPMQITGYNVKLSQKTKKNINENVQPYLFSAHGSYDNDMLEFDYRRFKTKVFYSMKEYLGFATVRGIEIPDVNKLNEMLDGKAIIVSYSYLSSTPAVEYSNTYNLEDKTFIELNVTSSSIETDDIAMKGVVLILDKDYIKENVTTLSKYLILK